MYKKLLFLLIVLPLTHSSTIHSSEPDACDRACGSFLGTFALGAVATTLFCVKERSMNNEIVLPLMATTFFGAGAGATFSLTSTLCKKLVGSRFPKIRNFCENASKVIPSTVIGSLVLLCCYHKNR